ncbi:calpain-1 catalytic subunit-like [Antennarius striatus]|uniref:calpain-1 catalytic subunit-like n=1 Tax=Antennarius striatus TaxID=241820 RepID=UPI0035B0C1B6
MPLPGVCSSIMNERQKMASFDGFGTMANPVRFLNQDFQQLKQYCLFQRVRYIDEMFPPDKRSIGQGVLSPEELQRVEWRRPGKLVPNPSFTVEGISRFDFGQGMIGDCWFLASIGALTFQRDILAQVIPHEQTFDQDYCGMFHFRFWRFGRWVDVVIDDKLPTINGELIFVHSKDPTEFWPALLEKAYAKVCGSYTDMNAGTPAEAMVDFTGGIHMCIQLSDPPSNLWELMFRAGQSKSLMSCGTPQGETSENTVLSNGVVEGHAYAVTGVKQMLSNGEVVSLVRLWNPWGRGEWNGDWSDQSYLWETVSPQDREMCHSVRSDGEFWMTMDDFCKFYEDLDICCLCPDFLDGGSSCHWKSSFYDGRWVAGTSAGGCINNKDSFWKNPQYRVKIDRLKDECSSAQGKYNMLVSLMQKPDKRNRRLVKNLYIGFSIFELTGEYRDHKGKLPASFFNSHTSVAQSKMYMNAREVMELVKLEAGEYLIVPSTYDPNETASFILTILSKAEIHVHDNSGANNYRHTEEESTEVRNGPDDEYKRDVYHQLTEKYEEVDAEALQKLLNDKIMNGAVTPGRFSIDACRSMVALMDTNITGKLDGEEFYRLWNTIVTYKDIFYRTDVSKTGALTLMTLRKAIMATGLRVSDGVLNLMGLRYSNEAGLITLESFISLALRFKCMTQIFKRISDGNSMTLRESEWLYLSIYT